MLLKRVALTIIATCLWISPGGMRCLTFCTFYNLPTLPGDATYHLALSLLSRLPRLILSPNTPNHEEIQTPSKPTYKFPKVKQNPTNYHNEGPSYGAISVDSVPGAHPKLPQSNYGSSKPTEEPNFKQHPTREKEVHFIARPLPTYRPKIVKQKLVTHQPRPTSDQHSYHRKVPYTASIKHQNGSLDTKKEIPKLVISVPYYPPPVQTHYSPPPPRQEMETMVENLHSVLSHHVSTFSTPQPLKNQAKVHGEEEHTVEQFMRPVFQQQIESPEQHMGSIVLHASPKHPITSDVKIFTPEKIPSFVTPSNKQKTAHLKDTLALHSSTRPLQDSTPPKVFVSHSHQGSTTQPETNSQLLDSFSWVHAPPPIGIKQSNRMPGSTSRTKTAIIPQLNNAPFSLSQPGEVGRSKTEKTFFSKMLLHALKPSSLSDKSNFDTETILKKTASPNPSLNEVRIDPDSFSFRLDKMLKKLSALKSMKTTFKSPAKSYKPSAVQDEEGTNFQSDGNEVKDISLEDKIEYDSSMELEVQDDEEEGSDLAAAIHIKEKKKNNIAGKNYLGEKKDNEEVKSNQEKKEKDNEDLVAAARLEQMINSLSAFRLDLSPF